MPSFIVLPSRIVLKGLLPFEKNFVVRLEIIFSEFKNFAGNIARTRQVLNNIVESELCRRFFFVNKCEPKGEALPYSHFVQYI